MQFLFKSLAAFAVVPENRPLSIASLKEKFSKALMQNGKGTCAEDYFKTFWLSLC